MRPNQQRLETVTRELKNVTPSSDSLALVTARNLLHAGSSLSSSFLSPSMRESLDGRQVCALWFGFAENNITTPKKEREKK
jgi:hypothetical protein